MKTMTEDEEKDPSVIPEDIKEFIREAHKERNESRPDEGWRITPAAKPDAVNAPYKRDDEETPEGSEKPDILEQLKSMGMNYDAGGATPDLILMWTQIRRFRTLPMLGQNPLECRT
jgi:hypothetical protein